MDYLSSSLTAAMATSTAITSSLGRDLASASGSALPFCVGFYHGCVVINTTQVKCWGTLNSIGAGGSGSSIGVNPGEVGDNLSYTNIGNGLSISEMHCGGFHTCFKLSSNGLKCLGVNNNGQIGVGVATDPIGPTNGYSGDTLPLVNIGNSLNILGFTLGALHSCVKVTGNRVKCFGLGDNGQLGYGSKSNKGASASDMGDNLDFVDLGTGIAIASVHSGPKSYHNCAIVSAPPPSADKIKCWGYNSNSQLGYGDVIQRGDDAGEMGDNLLLVDLGTESRVKQLALGHQHTCALLFDNSLKCFGRGDEGQLGSGSTDTISSTGNSLQTVAIDSGKTIKYIAAGEFHNCIAYDDMVTMKCFGHNFYGQLGQGDVLDRGKVPTTIIPSIPVVDLGAGTGNISAIALGASTSCVIFDSSLVKCFGLNNQGQCLVGTGTNIGDGTGEMGNNLEYALFVSPTKSPTKSPSNRPSKSPIKVVPTRSPSIPTRQPSAAPITGPTKSPTSSPTRYVAPYVPLKADCYMLVAKAECEIEKNGACGVCVFFSEKVYYGFRVTIDFVMEGSTRFSQFESTSPSVTTFKDAVKQLISANLNGEERIIINKIGQIYQPTGSQSGYVDYEVNFVDSKSNKEAAKTFFKSKPDLSEYVDDLNLNLNKKMKTTGRKYITGSIKIKNVNIIDRADGKGSCGCPNDDSSSDANILLPSFGYLAAFSLIFNLIMS